jgi:hypothetical protein
VQREHQAAKGKMRPLDTIRLEVLTNGDKELFASPGDRKFSENHPMSYAGSGTLGNGLFGPYLKQILVSGSVASHYKGEEEVGRRLLARYDYEISPLISGQMIHMLEGSGKVGLHGSYWVDEETYDVLRLEMNADEFPPTLPVTEMTQSINYARTVPSHPPPLRDRVRGLRSFGPRVRADGTTTAGAAQSPPSDHLSVAITRPRREINSLQSRATATAKARDVVNFKTAEMYLAITERQRQKLIRAGSLTVSGQGQNRKITTESLRRYLPPEKTKRPEATRNDPKHPAI